MKPGVLITFEGPEGAGKTTQIQKLAELLAERGFEVIRTYEPGGGPELCRRIRELILNPDLESMCEETELMLMLAARAEHVRRTILPALSQGKIVLCDRFVDSSLAYQGYGRGLPLKVIRDMNQVAIRGRFPDLTLLLDLDVKVGLARAAAKRGMDRIEREEHSFHEKVRQGFLQIAEEEDRFYVVDASLPEQEVSERIQQRVFNLVGKA